MDDKIKIPLLKNLVDEQTKGLKPDPSFSIALANYSNHQGVRDLGTGDLVRVIDQVSAETIKRHPDAIDGNSVTETLVYGFGCSQGMGECQKAAETILGRTIPVNPTPGNLKTRLNPLPTGVKVDPTFYLALDNYTNHYGVRNLGDNDLNTVINSVATEALKLGGGVANGKCVTDALITRFGCKKAMGECHKAAATILHKTIDVDLDQEY